MVIVIFPTTTISIPSVSRLLLEAEQHFMRGAVSQGKRQLAASPRPAAVGLPHISVLEPISAQTAAAVVVVIIVI
jgi:hypothetical protein